MSMLLDTYQHRSAKYDMGKGGSPDWYYALGVAGEAGETVEIIKKSYRAAPFCKPVDVGALVLEMGDVLWYLAALARHYGISLSEIAERNLAKLEDREQARYAQEAVRVPQE